eukprot:7343316-Prymnesium_polylepis.1
MRRGGARGCGAPSRLRRPRPTTCGRSYSRGTAPSCPSPARAASPPSPAHTARRAFFVWPPAVLAGTLDGRQTSRHAAASPTRGRARRNGTLLPARRARPRHGR